VLGPKPSSLSSPSAGGSGAAAFGPAAHSPAGERGFGAVRADGFDFDSLAAMRLTDVGGDYLDLAAVGYQFKTATDDLDRNWLVILGSVKHESTEWEFVS
jgi:hypothetical protein